MARGQHASKTSVFFLLLATALFLPALFQGCSGGNSNPVASQSQSPVKNVVPAPTIAASVSPATIAAGAQATISWTTTNAQSVSIDQGLGAQTNVNGSATVAPTATTTYTLTATSSDGRTASASVTVNIAPAPTLTFGADLARVASGQSVTLTWSSTNANAVTINDGQGQHGASGTETVSPTSSTTFTATATGIGGTVSRSVSILVVQPGIVSVTTYHNDQSRTGVNNRESVLNPANVNARQFGKVLSYPVDGAIYGQPLYVPALRISGVTHNVVFVATQHDSVYAFDADGLSTSPLWRTSVGTARPAASQFDISPESGITATPVIDTTSQTIYVANYNNLALELHALDLLTGAEKHGSPVTVTASVTNTSGTVESLGAGCLERSALALANGQVYLSYGHCDWGWVLAYDAGTLQQTAVFNGAPDGIGGTVWMSGGAPAIDSAGNLFVVTGTNFGAAQPGFNSSVVKLSSHAALQDYFTPSNVNFLIQNDRDFGSGGAILMPDNTSTHPHQLIAAGKDGRIFVLDRDHLGGISGSATANGCVGAGAYLQCIQTGTSDGNNVHSTPAFWNGRLYIHSNDDVLRVWGWSNGVLTTTTVDAGSQIFSAHASTVSISSNGNTDGIVWELDNTAVANNGPTVLHAYDAMDVNHELYNSSLNVSRDQPGPAVKFTLPTVADGKVFVGTGSELDIYGLLP